MPTLFVIVNVIAIQTGVRKIVNKKSFANRKKIPCFFAVPCYSVSMKKEITTIEQAKKLSTLEFMDLSTLERKLLDELKRVESQVEYFQRALEVSDQACETLRKARDSYRKQLGISSDWDTMESVRDKYDARHGG